MTQRIHSVEFHLGLNSSSVTAMSLEFLSLTMCQTDMDSSNLLNQGLKRLNRKNETGIFIKI